MRVKFPTMPWLGASPIVEVARLRERGWTEATVTEVSSPSGRSPAAAVLAARRPFDGLSLRVPLDKAGARMVATALEERRAPTMWQRIERFAAHIGERLGLYVLRGHHSELVAILRTRDGLSLAYTVLDLEHALDASVRLDLPLLVEVALLRARAGSSHV